MKQYNQIISSSQGISYFTQPQELLDNSPDPTEPDREQTVKQ